MSMIFMGIHTAVTADSAEPSGFAEDDVSITKKPRCCEPKDSSRLAAPSKMDCERSQSVSSTPRLPPYTSPAIPRNFCLSLFTSIWLLKFTSSKSIRTPPLCKTAAQAGGAMSKA